MTSILSETLAPPRIATNGRSGARAPARGTGAPSSISRPATACGTQLRNALGRGVRAMRRPERVVHVDVGERRQLLRERRVVLLLFRVEAQVLEQRRRCRPEPAPARWPSAPVADAVRRELTARPSSRARCAATGSSENSGFGLPLGRPRCDARITVAPVLERVLDGRERRADARVVLDAPFLDRHVEIDADEDTLPAHVEVTDRQLRHGTTPCRGRKTRTLGFGDWGVGIRGSPPQTPAATPTPLTPNP